MENTAVKSQEPFFEVRLISVATNAPLSFDLYLVINSKPILFRKRGDTITQERVRSLIRHGGEKFLVPEDQRTVYLQSLKDKIRDPDTSTETKGKLIKESAFIHVNDLFTKQDIKPAITEAKALVEEMVLFVSTDVEAITSLMRLSVHDYYTYNHCVDVAVYSVALAKKIYGEDKELLLLAGLGGLLHDIGKRRIDEGVINKATALTEIEWAEMKNHPVYGRDFLKDIPFVPQEAKDAVYEHHENFDGTGYPQKIKEENISKLARIVTIADVFDALTTQRSYHKAVGSVEALNTMYSMQPGKFDPMIFKSFNKNFEKKSPIELAGDFDPCQAEGAKKIKSR